MEDPTTMKTKRTGSLLAVLARSLTRAPRKVSTTECQTCYASSDDARSDDASSDDASNEDSGGSLPNFNERAS